MDIPRAPNSTNRCRSAGQATIGNDVKQAPMTPDNNACATRNKLRSIVGRIVTSKF